MEIKVRGSPDINARYRQGIRKAYEFGKKIYLE